MEKTKENLYYKGYIAGYRDGICDAACGKNRVNIENDITRLPIIAMALSSRAQNCLHRAGCTYIADVAALSDYTIATMRNLGAKSASEIACWLDAHGICYTAWSKYL